MGLDWTRSAGVLVTGGVGQFEEVQWDGQDGVGKSWLRIRGLQEELFWGTSLSIWGLFTGEQSSLQRTQFLLKEANSYEHCSASGGIKDFAHINGNDEYF